MPNSPVKMNSYAKKEVHPQGRIGQDTRRSLVSLGYSGDHIDALVNDGIIVD